MTDPIRLTLVSTSPVKAQAVSSVPVGITIVTAPMISARLIGGGPPGPHGLINATVSSNSSTISITGGNTTLTLPSANTTHAGIVRPTDITRFDTTGVSAIIGGTGDVIEAGVAGDIQFPYACDIISVSLVADQTGSIELDLRVADYDDLPPTTSICASTRPKITNGAKSKDTTLTGWDTFIPADGVMRVHVLSASTITRVTLSFKLRKR